VGTGDAEAVCHKADQVLVGLAVHRRGCDADLELAAQGLAQLVSMGPRLDSDADQEIVAFPTEPAPLARLIAALPPVFQNGLPVRALSGGISNISSMTRAIMTAMGERSSPLTGGISRRAGPSRGAVRRSSSLTAGL
jgi:hypothetical protein